MRSAPSSWSETPTTPEVAPLEPFAVVAVDDRHVRADQAHYYAIPDALRPQLQVGGLLVVPYGRRLRRGWLLGCDAQAPVEAVKPLAAVLAEAPAFTLAQIQLARWISRRSNIAIARALAIAMPNATLDACLPRLGVANGGAATLQAQGKAPALLKRLQAGPLRLDRAWLLVPPGSATLLPELAAAGVVHRLPPATALPPAAIAPQTTLAPSASPPATAPAEPPAPITAVPALPDRATREMCSAVFADVTNGRGGVFVVTAPFWPAAAIEQLVRHAAIAGKQTLILLPRPARRGDDLRALIARFPDALSLRGTAGLGAIAARQPALTIGGRWTPLAAFARLGLVLVIDEHDPAFAGDFAPFLHGREIALQAARFARASTVLFSPNPDPATLWRASRAGVRRFTLGSPPPLHVQTVDLRQELRAGRNTFLSTPLRQALASALAAGEQAVLFLNRRGAARMLLCRRCGVTLQCRRCSTALAYHAADGLLRCHSCNAGEPRPDVCPRCRTPTLEELGAGVQRLAQEVQTAFPAVRLGRWDSDAAPDAAAGRALAGRFAGGEIDVLVGTLPVALAESLPPVALAAAVLADLGLNLPDYRAAERSYEQLAALRRRVVAGGQFILQSYQPSHWVLQALAADDPALYYGEELRRRQELGYPPFRQLARLTYRAASRQRCEEEAQRVRAALIERLAEVAPEVPDAVLGPAPAYAERVKGVYRWQLHLRAPNVQALLGVVPPYWIVEVDPEDLR